MVQVPDKIQVEIDVESEGFLALLKNIETGFKDLNRKIFQLRMATGALGFSVVAQAVALYLK